MSRSASNARSMRPLAIAVAIHLAFAGGLLTMTSWQSSAYAQAKPAARQYNIPAGSLGNVLTRFSSESGVLLAAPAELVQGKNSNGLQGNFNTYTALHALLSGTGLEALQEANGQYRLQTIEKTTTLAPVTVRASTENASGPISGYAAKRSASATKTDTPIIEIPQSITVIGAEEIETLKAQSLQDALNYAAGVSRAEGVDRTTDSFFLRGFRTDMGSIYRDGGLYTVNIYNGRQEPYGLERIELLKGAASVLYGAAAPGGIINTVSKRPTTTPLRELNVELGSFGRKQISGDFAGALDKDGDWSYRLTFLQRDSKTSIDYIPDDRTYIAPAIKWQPNAATSLTLLAEYQKDRTTYTDGLPAQGTVLPNINGQISRKRFTGEPGFDKFKLERYSIGYLFEHAFNEQWKLRNSLRYYHAENEYNYTWGWGLAANQRTTQFRGVNQRVDASSSVISDTSLQYQATHGNVQHTALVGVDYSLPKHESERYSRSVGSLDLFAPVYGSTMGPAMQNAGSSWKSDMRRLGVYAQEQMKINDKWVVLLGGRHDSVRYNEKAYFSGEKIADNEKSSAFTARAGLVYLADNGLAPFFSYSESFEPTSGRDRLGNRFKPTTGEQYELGIRYQPKGSDTMLSAAVYQLTRDNATVSDPLDSNYSIQYGRVRSRGLELEARTRIGRNANLIAAYAYTDAFTLQASPLQPEQVGQRLNSVPYNQLSLWGDYSFGAYGLPGLKIGGGMRYVDETRGMGQGTAVTVPAFTLFDAMASYTIKQWRFALNINNLTDKTYVASCTYACFYGEPRKVIGTATYRW